MDLNYFAQQPQPVRGQDHGQHNHNQIPDTQPAMQFADPAFQDYIAGSNIPGYQNNNVVMPFGVPSTPAIPHAFPPQNGPPVGPPGPMFPNPHVGYPVAPQHGQPMSHHTVYQPTDFLGTYNTAAGPSSFHWTPRTIPNPPQIPTPTPPISHLRHSTATNPLSPNSQGPMGVPFPQSLPPVTPNQVPLFPPPPPR